MKTKVVVPLQQKTLRLCGLLVACAATAGALGAQSPARRITAEINSSQMSSLKGSEHPLALPQNDAGRMPGDTRLNGISLYFNRSAAQEADLQALLVAQQDPSSPQFHQWLTPDQYAARFGVAQADIDQVRTWLQQQGFAIDSVARSRNMIRFSGTVTQVEQAFSTQMHYYMAGGIKHFAPSTALSVPAAMAPMVAGIRNLNDFRPRPQFIKGRGAFTSGSTGNVFFAPGDIATTYDITPLYSASTDGTGQSIAIAGQSAIQVSDIENFQNAAGLTVKDPTLVLVPGTGDSQVQADGDEGESDLDVEWSGAIARGANIVFVYTGSSTNFGVFDAAQYAVDQMLAPIISISYDTCELNLTASDVSTLESIFSQAATQGQTVSVASGDQGSTACFISNPPATGDPPLATQEALAVNYPASSAYATGVGGTEISSADSTSSNSTYWTAASGSDVITSAKTYIPEITWNDSSSQGGLSATGGGISTFVAQPSWQTSYFTATGATNPSSSFRLVPDVAFYSSPGFPGYLYCTSDQTNWNTTQPPLQTGSCGAGFRASSSDNTLTVAGGTSFAAPIFAGMVAILNQKLNYTTGQGLINSSLYKLAATSAYATAFHDVTSGNNYCTAGSSFCASNGATLGYQAGTGYDMVTGLGSFDLNVLAGALPANTGTSASLTSTTTQVVPANATPNANTAVAFTITVTSASGSSTPTGTVTLQVDGGTNCGGIQTTCGGTTVTGQALSNGTFQYSATFTTAGVHSIIAQYSGDSTHAASTGVGSVTVGGTSSGKGSFTMSATNVTESQGTQGMSTITVTPAGGYTGTVLLSFTTSNDTALANLCYEFASQNTDGTGSVTVSGTAAATTTLTFDSNANDCASTTGAAKPGKGMRSISSLLSKKASRGPAPRPAPNRAPLEAAFAGLLLAGFLGRYARKFRAAAWILVLAAAGLAISACGGGGGGSSSVPDPPKGTYTITLTGADSVTATITGTTTFTLTID